MNIFMIKSKDFMKNVIDFGFICVKKSNKILQINLKMLHKITCLIELCCID